MEQVVRQRFVGAAVLTALAIIALPLMFDLERPAPIKVTEEMPLPPPIPEIKHEMPKPPEPLQADPVPVSDMYALNGKAEAVQPVAGESVPPPVAVQDPAAQTSTAQISTGSAPTGTQPAKNPVKPAPQLKPTEPLPAVPPAPGGKLDAKGVPEAWVVQVAAMSDQAKANIMIKQLKDKGFTAFAVAGKAGNSNTVRVFIGPKLDKAAAMKIKQSVDKTMGLQTMVVPFSAR